METVQESNFQLLADGENIYFRLRWEREIKEQIVRLVGFYRPHYNLYVLSLRRTLKIFALSGGKSGDVYISFYSPGLPNAHSVSCHASPKVYFYYAFY